jgi:A/G-specific adenine glycosylase
MNPSSRHPGTRHLRRAILAAGRLGAQLFPWRQAPTTYGVLVAEVLLQHTPVRRVTPVFTVFVARWPDFAALAQANRRVLETVLRPLGLQRRRSADLQRLARLVVEEWGGNLRPQPEVLACLPGVGPYTAGVTAAVVNERAAGFADAGVARLLRRFYGLSPGPVADPYLWQLSLDITRGRHVRLSVWGLLDLSREVCRPQPRCEVCPIRYRCAYGSKRVNITRWRGGRRRILPSRESSNG